MKIESLKKIAIKCGGKVKLFSEKYSPEILIGVGVGLVVVGTISACKSTLKANEILESHQKDIQKVKDVKEKIDSGVYNVQELLHTDYTETDYKKDICIVYVNTMKKFAKLYAKSTIMITTGIVCILTSHKLMLKRTAALAAAYNIVDSEFKKYRENVVNEFGEDVDKKMKLGDILETKAKEVLNSNKDDKNDIQTTKTKNTDKPSCYSSYARFFDETNPNYTDNPELNMIFLKAQQNYLNDLLITRKFVLLNEVYDALGFPMTKAGAVVGWTLRSHGNGDGYIDFNLYDIYSAAKREFVNGYESVILLDFNVDGVIIDYIDELSK